MPRTLWITGLSGAGKSTVAIEVARMLRDKDIPVVLLDGDQLREVFLINSTDNSDYGRDERLQLAMTYARMCKMLSNQKLTVIIATISMFQEVYDWNRKNIPGYFEVYLLAPVEELKRRDPKQIYKNFELGYLKNVAGLDLEVDEPKNPDLLIEFNSSISAEQSAQEIIQKLERTDNPLK